MKVDLEHTSPRLGDLAARGDYLQTLKFLQQTEAGQRIIVQMAGCLYGRRSLRNWTELADQTSFVEYYR